MPWQQWRFKPMAIKVMIYGINTMTSYTQYSVPIIYPQYRTFGISSMASCKTAVTPLLTHPSYCSLVLSNDNDLPMILKPTHHGSKRSADIVDARRYLNHPGLGWPLCFQFVSTASTASATNLLVIPKPFKLNSRYLEQTIIGLAKCNGWIYMTLTAVALIDKNCLSLHN